MFETIEVDDLLILFQLQGKKTQNFHHTTHYLEVKSTKEKTQQN